MKSIREMDNQYQLEQARLAKIAADAARRNAYLQGLDAEFLQNGPAITTSLLGVPSDDAVPEVKQLDIPAILKDLELEKINTDAKLAAATTLKTITGAVINGLDARHFDPKQIENKARYKTATNRTFSRPEPVRTGEKVHYEFACQIEKLIYSGRINVLNLLPRFDYVIDENDAKPEITVDDIKQLLVAEIKKANLNSFKDLSPDGLALMLEGFLDRPTLFLICQTLHRHIADNAALIDNVIELHTVLLDKPAPRLT